MLTDKAEADELIHFYNSQKIHGEDYLKKLLELWKQNERRAYRMAVQRITNATEDS